MRIVFLFLLFCSLGVLRAQEPPSPLETERVKNEEAALTMWPEAGDPESIMGREIRRLLDYYTARKDPRLRQVTAPMWIASQAAANTERLRTDAESQRTAMRLYPEVGVLDSPLNKLFRETHARYQEVDPKFFADPRWPIRLAQQCALQLDARAAVASMQLGDAPGGLQRVTSETTTDVVEVADRPWRKWVLWGIVALVGAAIIFGIARHLHRRGVPPLEEQDGSSI